MRHREGVFAVPMVHSTLLIQLRDPVGKSLAYDPPPPGYSGPVDDIIVFAHSVQHLGLTMYIDNRHFYGFLLAPPGDDSTLDHERSEFLHLKLENIGKTPVQKCLICYPLCSSSSTLLV